jgi:hypothetical protein
MCAPSVEKDSPPFSGLERRPEGTMNRNSPMAAPLFGLLVIGCASPNSFEPTGADGATVTGPAMAPDAAAGADAATPVADGAGQGSSPEVAADSMRIQPGAAADLAGPTAPPTISLLAPETCGLAVSINGAARPATGATVDGIQFDWNDGVVEKRFFPATHSYGVAGVYMVKATALQSDGLSASASTSVKVTVPTGKAPTVFLLEPTVEGRNVTINGGTAPGDPATPVRVISWEWGDGTVNESFFPHKHTYPTAGTFTVRATSRQCDGQTAVATVTVTVR